MRRLALITALSSLSTAAIADAVTTRIETRPYYGAIATVEQGVRVWRALPPEDRIIIVPESAKNVAVNIDVGSNRTQAPPPIVNRNININQSGSVGGHDVVGIPSAYGHKRMGDHAGAHRRYDGNHVGQGAVIGPAARAR